MPTVRLLPVLYSNEELEPYTLAEVQENNKIFHVYTRADGSIYRKFVRDVP